LSSRNIRAGQTIKLLARFKDDLGNPTSATTVKVSIFEPGEDTSILANAIIQLDDPTYLGEGIYEYEYLIPACGPAGIWTDQWTGDLTCQPLDNDLNFNVVADGVITSLDNQLFPNNILQIIINDIEALDGSDLTDNIELEFLTTTNPSYSNIRRIRLEVGGFIKELNDLVIQTAILEGSIETDVLTFTTSRLNRGIFEHARRQYVTCYVSSILLGNLNNNLLKSKTLGDLSVQYDTSGINRTLDRLKECMNKWQGQLMTGGAAKSIGNPVYAIKGAWDPDRPPGGRMWESTSCSIDTTPAANTKIIKPFSRRPFFTKYTSSIIYSINTIEHFRFSLSSSTKDQYNWCSTNWGNS